jgi:acyl dehydratase
MATVIYERELPCFLAWPRRNPIPAHPNFHTDDDAARAAGFPGVIMSSSQLVAHIHQALVEIAGVSGYFGGMKVAYKMVRPVPVPGIARVVVEKSEESDELAVRIEDGLGNVCIVGTAQPPQKDRQDA